MRALLQRVSRAEVTVEGAVVGQIAHGLLVYVGVAADDGPADAQRLADKIAGLRIFSDPQGKLNLTVQDVRGAVLAVSNFTLLGDARNGRRPSFVAAAGGAEARTLFGVFVAALQSAGCTITPGRFGEHMTVRSDADGPVNVIVDSPASAPADPAEGPSATGPP